MACLFLGIVKLSYKENPDKDFIPYLTNIAIITAI